MTEMTKELVVARLANMRGEILSKIQPSGSAWKNRERLFCLSENLLNVFRM